MSRCCTIIQIDNKLVDSAILREYFHCDLAACHGACCHEGSEGAPLTAEEIISIEDHIQEILPALSLQGRVAVESDGVAYRAADGDWVTQLQPNADCAYAVHCAKCNSLLCALERIGAQGKGTPANDTTGRLQKPLSCALYPIRTGRSGSTIMLRYDRWRICDPARRLGEKMHVRVYEFLRAPLERAYGVTFYQQLTEAAARLQREEVAK